MFEFLIVLAAIASIVGVVIVVRAITRKPSLPQHTDEEAIRYDWDKVLLGHAVETATDFLTIDEVLADYEKHSKK